jgi:hypothetical protein
MNSAVSASLSADSTQSKALHDAFNDEPLREPLVLGKPTLHDVTRKVLDIIESKPNIKFLAALSVTLMRLFGEVSVLPIQ